MKLPAKEQFKIIKEKTVEVLPEEELLEKLERSVKQKKPLIVKQGFDPTVSDIHLGHTVSIRKLKQFQDLGHKVVFLIGDFTAMIGDPSGRSETRKRLSRKEVLKNARTYQNQVFKILDPQKTTIDFNSRWSSKFKAFDFLKLASMYSVARLLERDDFSQRYKTGTPISILEFLYPLLQGYDSVALKADVEMGGTDQKFNLLVGREIQRGYGQEPQVIITMPLLVGTEGTEKMSKSLGNYIGISEPPREIFGKIMSIPDSLILQYFELLTDLPSEELLKLKEELEVKKTNPMLLKKRLGHKLVEVYYNKKIADLSQSEFEKVFSQKELPQEIPSIVFKSKEEEVWVGHLCTQTGMTSSTSEAKRLIKQGGLYIDNQRITDENLKIKVAGEKIFKLGKRKFFKVLLERVPSD